MYTLVSVADRGSFELEGAPSIEATYQRLAQSGATRPEWCQVLQRDGVDIGRLGFRVQPSCPPEFLGRLPAREVYTMGLWLRWDDPDVREAGAFLLAHATDAIRRDLPEAVQAVFPRDERAEQRRSLLEAFGMELFQEKQGYGWRRGEAPPTDHPR